MPPVSLSQVERASKLSQGGSLGITRSSLGYLDLVDKAITQTYGLTEPPQPVGNTIFSRGMHLLHRRGSSPEVAGISIGLVLLFVLVGAGLYLWIWKATEAEKRRRARKHRKREEHQSSHRHGHRQHHTYTKESRHRHVKHQHNHDHNENHHHGIHHLHHDPHEERHNGGLEPLAVYPGHHHHHHRHHRRHRQGMEHQPDLRDPEAPFLQQPEPALLSPSARSSHRGQSVQPPNEMDAPQFQRGIGWDEWGLSLSDWWALGQREKGATRLYPSYGPGRDGHGR